MEENHASERATYRSLNSRKKKLNSSMSWRERLTKGKETIKGDLENLLRDKFTGNHGIKMARKRERVICEIFSTERKYQHHLAVIIEHFLAPLESLGHIPCDDHRIIFENITSIQAVNRELLAHMEEKGIAPAFIKLAPFMKVYCTYANNFEKASHKLQEWERKRAAFVQFLREQEAKPECGNLSLHALLITPIQRIPRYKLLLEELLNSTAENHEDYENLQEAAARMTEVTRGINEYIREHENFQKMLLIQNSLNGVGTPRILAPGRRFIMEGSLMKVNRKGSSAHERMFFLFNDMLIYAKPNLLEPSLSSRSFSCRSVIPLHQCQVKCVLGDKNIAGTGALFKVEYGENSLLLYSTNHHIALSWIDALQGAIQQLQRKPHTSRKPSTKTRGAKRISLGKMVRSLGMRSSVRQKNMRNYPEPEDANNSQDTLHPMRMELSRSTYRRPNGPGNTSVKMRNRRLQRGPLQVKRNHQDSSHIDVGNTSHNNMTETPDTTAYYDCYCKMNESTTRTLYDKEQLDMAQQDMAQQDMAQQAFCTIL